MAMLDLLLVLNVVFGMIFKKLNEDKYFGSVNNTIKFTDFKSAINFEVEKTSNQKYWFKDESKKVLDVKGGYSYLILYTITNNDNQKFYTSQGNKGIILQWNSKCLTYRKSEDLFYFEGCDSAEEFEIISDDTLSKINQEAKPEIKTTQIVTHTVTIKSTSTIDRPTTTTSVQTVTNVSISSTTTTVTETVTQRVVRPHQNSTKGGTVDKYVRMRPNVYDYSEDDYSSYSDECDSKGCFGKRTPKRGGKSFDNFMIPKKRLAKLHKHYHGYRSQHEESTQSSQSDERDDKKKNAEPCKRNKTNSKMIGYIPTTQSTFPDKYNKVNIEDFDQMIHQSKGSKLTSDIEKTFDYKRYKDINSIINNIDNYVYRF